MDWARLAAAPATDPSGIARTNVYPRGAGHDVIADFRIPGSRDVYADKRIDDTVVHHLAVTASRVQRYACADRVLDQIVVDLMS
jgi:hypothetical protein